MGVVRAPSALVVCLTCCDEDDAEDGTSTSFCLQLYLLACTVSSAIDGGTSLVGVRSCVTLCGCTYAGADTFISTLARLLGLPLSTAWPEAAAAEDGTSSSEPVSQSRVPGSGRPRISAADGGRLSTSAPLSSLDDEEDIDGEDAMFDERETSGSCGDVAVGLILILLRCRRTRLGRAKTCGRETVMPEPASGWTRMAAPVTCSERTPSPTVVFGTPKRPIVGGLGCAVYCAGRGGSWGLSLLGLGRPEEGGESARSRSSRLGNRSSALRLSSSFCGLDEGFQDGCWGG